MIMEIDEQVLKEIQAHGEQAYPEEGAGLLLGSQDGERNRVVALVKLPNSREAAARRNRYLLTAEDYLRGEEEADRRGLEVLGVFHSHPDHPNQPSEFDREWAWPALSYLITSVASGRAGESRSWRLAGDRDGFLEERLIIRAD